MPVVRTFRPTRQPIMCIISKNEDVIMIKSSVGQTMATVDFTTIPSKPTTADY